VPLAAIVFHELAEAYSKVDLQKPYLDFELGMMLNRMIVVTPTAFLTGSVVGLNRAVEISENRVRDPFAN
jgi:hypothetical protein